MQPHQPVLEESVISLLAPKPGERYIDATAGYGGHAAHIIDAIGKDGQTTLLDRDPEAIDYLKQKFRGKKNITMVQTGFADYQWEENSANMILIDLGVSSVQIDKSKRGFSFKATAPLDMRMDPGQELSAYDVVNGYQESDLANVIYQYGEERQSRAIARKIVEQRNLKPIQTTTELADIVRSVVRSKTKIDPATRTFQAIRIETNQELRQLEDVLPHAVKALRPQGRLAVISFHSLEDRIVKQFFQSIRKPEQDPVTGAALQPANFQMVTKKPISGLINDNNPRARSAKLRAVEKIN